MNRNSERERERERERENLHRYKDVNRENKKKFYAALQIYIHPGSTVKSGKKEVSQHRRKIAMLQQPIMQWK